MSGRRGFTLIEVLVAISIMTSIIFWPTAIIAQKLVFDAVTKETIRAQLLAQNIIEHIRFHRDTYAFNDSFRFSSWFEELRRNDGHFANPCMVNVDESKNRNGEYETYCIPQCPGANDELDDCSTNTKGFVSGISETQEREVGNEKTCDGRNPKPNGEFSPTLNIILPAENDAIQYAQIVSCVSWENKSGVVQRTEFKESMYEWLLLTP